MALGFSKGRDPLSDSQTACHLVKRSDGLEAIERIGIAARNPRLSQTSCSSQRRQGSGRAPTDWTAWEEQCSSSCNSFSPSQARLSQLSKGRKSLMPSAAASPSRNALLTGRNPARHRIDPTLGCLRPNTPRAVTAAQRSSAALTTAGSETIQMIEANRSRARRRTSSNRVRPARTRSSPMKHLSVVAILLAISVACSQQPAATVPPPTGTDYKATDSVPASPTGSATKRPFEPWSPSATPGR
jgi:hypothetical protein